MAKLPQWIDRWISKDEIEEDEDSPFQRLLKLRDDHVFIDVHVARTDRHFHSMILEVDGDNETLLLDEFLPNNKEPDLRQGDTIEITSRSKQYAVKFFSRVLNKFRDEQGPSYQIQLPDELGANPLQQVYRVYVESENQLTVTLPEVNSTPLKGHIVNLSPVGIKLNIEGDWITELNKHHCLEEVVISLPTGLKLSVEVDLRTLFLAPGKELRTIASGTMKLDSAPERVKLEQYLASIQRMQRRRELRS